MVGVNPDKWKSIAPADQAAILRISGEALAKASGIAHDAFTKEATETLIKGGATVFRVEGPMLEQMKQRVKPVETAWYEKARKRGLADPERALDDLRKDISANTPK